MGITEEATRHERERDRKERKVRRMAVSKVRTLAVIVACDLELPRCYRMHFGAWASLLQDQRRTAEQRRATELTSVAANVNDSRERLEACLLRYDRFETRLANVEKDVQKIEISQNLLDGTLHP